MHWTTRVETHSTSASSSLSTTARYLRVFVRISLGFSQPNARPFIAEVPRRSTQAIDGGRAAELKKMQCDIRWLDTCHRSLADCGQADRKPRMPRTVPACPGVSDTRWRVTARIASSLAIRTYSPALPAWELPRQTWPIEDYGTRRNRHQVCIPQFEYLNPEGQAASMATIARSARAIPACRSSQGQNLKCADPVCRFEARSFLCWSPRKSLGPSRQAKISLTTLAGYCPISRSSRPCTL